MSNNKSLQRLIAVQAAYETSINDHRKNFSDDDIFINILQNSDFLKKHENAKLDLAKEIFQGVNVNLSKIDQILIKSLKNNIKFKSMDVLLKSIFRAAIFELSFNKKLSKNIVISEYLLISRRFFGENESAFLNGVLDNLRET